jgi:hypothetical protein
VHENGNFAHFEKQLRGGPEVRAYCQFFPNRKKSETSFGGQTCVSVIQAFLLASIFLPIFAYFSHFSPERN